MHKDPIFLDQKQKISNLNSDLIKIILYQFNCDEDKLLGALEQFGPFGLIENAKCQNEIYDSIVLNFVDPLTCKQAAEKKAIKIALGFHHLQEGYKDAFGLDELPVKDFELFSRSTNREGFKKWLTCCYIAIALNSKYSKQVSHKVFAMLRKDSFNPINMYLLKQVCFVTWSKLPIILMVAALCICLINPALPISFRIPTISVPLNLLNESSFALAILRQNSLFIIVFALIASCITTLCLSKNLWLFFTKKNNNPETIESLSRSFEGSILVLLIVGFLFKFNSPLQDKLDLLVQKQEYGTAISLIKDQQKLTPIQQDFILAQIYAYQFEATKSAESLLNTQRYANSIMNEIDYSWMQKNAVERIKQTSLRPYNQSIFDPNNYKNWWFIVFSLFILGRINLYIQKNQYKKKPE